LAGGAAGGSRPTANGGLGRGLPADGALPSVERADRTPPASAAVASGPAANVPATTTLAAKAEAMAAPPSLYFNPQLVTDTQGRATVEFVMPQVDSQYRLLIDALGQGRIGSRQDVFSCGK